MCSTSTTVSNSIPVCVGEHVSSESPIEQGYNNEQNKCEQPVPSEYQTHQEATNQPSNNRVWQELQELDHDSLSRASRSA